MKRPTILKPLDYLKRTMDRRYIGIRIGRPIPERVSQEKLEVADVLFCHGSKPLTSWKTLISWKIIKYGSSGSYVHVGIYLGDGKIAEATTKGVKPCDLDEFIGRYNYVVATRCPGVHGIPDLRSKVRIFCEHHIDKVTPYDFFGALLSPIFELFDLLHQRLSYRTIRFNWYRKNGKTFCSQFVLDAFVAGGYIDPKDYSLGARSPTALAEENFLDFLGYLSTEQDLESLVKNDLFWTGGG